MTSASTTPTTLDDLRASVAGRVITPDDADYEQARTVLVGGYDHLRPAAVVRVRDARDVASVIGYARATGAELAVRSGGHSGAGHSTTDGGVVIDLRDMKDIQVDPESRTAWGRPA